MRLNQKTLAVLKGKKIELNTKEIYDLSNNRFLHYSLLYSKKDKLTNHYFNESKLWIRKLKRTLLFLNSFFKKHKISHLIVKTYKHHPYVTFDVDVLVKKKDFVKVINLFEKTGLTLEKHPGKQALKQINIFRKGLLRIDLHKGFFWQGKVFFDESIIWKGTRKVKMVGVGVKVPSVFVEVLLNLAHILHERRYITYLDYFFLVKELQRVSKKKLLMQARKHSWGGSLKKLLKIFDYLKGNFLKAKFPYMLPLSLSIKTFTERYKKTGYFPKFDFAYFAFTTLRYYLTNKKRMPYYKHWFCYNSDSL